MFRIDGPTKHWRHVKAASKVKNMRPIKPELKKEILEAPEFQVCMRNAIFNDHVCQGRMTLEHAFIGAKGQINEKWAIMSLCAWGHDVDEFQDCGNIDKRKNEYCCIIRASEEDLAKYPGRDWEQLRKFLISKFGLPMPKKPCTLF